MLMMFDDNFFCIFPLWLPHGHLRNCQAWWKIGYLKQMQDKEQEELDELNLEFAIHCTHAIGSRN